MTVAGAVFGKLGRELNHTVSVQVMGEWDYSKMGRVKMENNLRSFTLKKTGG